MSKLSAATKIRAFRRLEIIQFRLTEKLMLTIPTGAPSFTDYLQPCVCTKVALEQSVLTIYSYASLVQYR